MSVETDFAIRWKAYETIASREWGLIANTDKYSTAKADTFARILGYNGWDEFMTMTPEARELLKTLAGPHGWTIWKAYKARYKAWG